MLTTQHSVLFAALLTNISIVAIFIFLGIIVFRAQRRYFLMRQEVCMKDLEALREERLRISRDLHDELGPILQLVLRQVECIKLGYGDGNQLSGSAHGLLKVITTRLDEISNGLDDQHIVHAGLEKSIRLFIGQYKLASQLYFQFRYSLHRELPPQLTVGLYRITLELINNTIRHAHATIVFITIKEKRNVLYFHYTDNGTGVHDAAHTAGNGLHNLQHRAGLLGGTLETDFTGSARFMIKIPFI